jgi:hypothetical protein
MTWYRVRSWALVFASVFAADFAWAVYVAQVKSGNAVAAAGWAVALFLLGAVAVIGYTRDRWLLIPACLGAALGTWCGVAWQL